ncbi:MAG: plastocyanin/azurin family copper-binding protein [Acidimicrobiales bacterium]
MRRTGTCIALALLTLVVTGCGDSDDDGGGDAAGDCSPVASSLTVGALDELAFDAESYDADAGCIEVTYENEGSVAHTLLVDGESGFKLAVGDTDTGTIELDAGEYTLYCDVAGHQAAGMEATLTVS